MKNEVSGFFERSLVCDEHVNNVVVSLIALIAVVASQVTPRRGSLLRSAPIPHFLFHSEQLNLQLIL